MVQALHGDGGVKTVFPKGHIEIGALEQGQVLFGELFPQPGEHPLGQVDAGDLGGGAQGEVEFQLQAGAAAQVQELAALFDGQGLGREGVQLPGICHVAKHVLVVQVQPGLEKGAHLF